MGQRQQPPDARNNRNNQGRIIQHPGPRRDRQTFGNARNPGPGSGKRTADGQVITNRPAEIPQNVEAEAALIGALLIDNEQIALCGKVEPEFFYRNAHKLIWRAIQELHEAGKVVDYITLIDMLRQQDHLEDAGGIEGVMSLGNHVPHSQNAPDYARIVTETYALRVTMRASADLTAVSYRGNLAELHSAWSITRDEVDRVLSTLHRTGEDGPRFRLKSIAEMRKRPRPLWILPGILQERKRWLIYGDSNTGKSFLALDMGLCLATGLPWHGRPVMPGIVVYVCAEGVDGVSARIDAWLKHHGLDDAPNFWVIDESPNLLEQGDVADIIVQINEALDEPPAAVIFDTLAASMAGADENGPEDMGIVLAAMRQVQRECQCGVMAVHHSGKDAAKGPRGHSSLRADFDTALEVSMEEGSKVVTVRCRKARDSDYPQDMAFRLKKVALDDFADVTSCVPEALDEPPAPDPRKARRKPTASDKLYVLMASLTTPLTHGELRRRFVDETAMSKEAFDKALEKLHREHRIVNFQGGWMVAEPTDINTARQPV